MEYVLEIESKDGWCRHGTERSNTIPFKTKE